MGITCNAENLKRSFPFRAESLTMLVTLRSLQISLLTSKSCLIKVPQAFLIMCKSR